MPSSACLCTTTTSRSSTAVTDALRGSPVSSAISPKNSPRDSRATSRSLCGWAGSSTVTIALPARITYIASPASPWNTTRSPRPNDSCSHSCDNASSSAPSSGTNTGTLPSTSALRFAGSAAFGTSPWNSKLVCVGNGMVRPLRLAAYQTRVMNSSLISCTRG